METWMLDPDPRGILSRPYQVVNGYAHPHLAEGIVVFPREVGTYPRSCVPRFVDVDDEDRESLALRKRQERQALFELTGLCNPDIYPWRNGQEATYTPGTLNMLYWHGPMSRQKWQLECYRTLNAACYLENWRVPGSRLWCYACHEGHPDIVPRTSPSLAKCLICIDVFMCYKHRIFLACLPAGVTATVCHSNCLLSTF
eukprot:1542051-Amphidinium_carterae.1